MDWNVSDVVTDKKSKFQARCCFLRDQKDIPDILQGMIQSDKHIAKASHMHMYAWRTGTEELKGNEKQTKKKNNKKQDEVVQLKNVQQGSSDCGEAGAGQRLLTLLERSNAFNVIVIVTRWYGGTPLGPARFRHICSAALQSLRIGGFVP
ncbi:uncharacterized protein GVI51_J06127 [Nakaseomyces glabratus]|uniref:Impact N-terminal domain-containing protein n=2 Tax=Candida glabrata TaxID=5478 RepID=Q6FP64_CANGA|nr:uncharacterized protein CAGL0J06292g [Nakaseomyces glabratus]KAH7583586.1 Uncharacterized protein family UPF0029 [Nakaseomyces glabratus]KAH7584076.1 Uncharacterized protein family UPF0029 [Nakaseomyces glabratus]KAH7585319.1 Uncharacterized protein family UPF0029 [Nakaseomyces glabratus]KAH7597820.1 Uncharacterized protein family UPF0029 [Nakaseomyces glabratus]KAH7598398.1 Uncharacterized protein family UPF0029 [Nakaseomyces glabratus]|eukprot:XP_447980.1 uncharacterized protein CAGL0J06292g [[Candida] glabrata]